MTRFTMPSSVEAAIRQLGVLGELATATEWKRSAIVAALIGPNPGYGGDRTQPSPYPYSTTSLAELGIVGLRTRATIGRYRNNWFSVRTSAPALDGSVIELPTEEWPEDPTSERARNRYQIIRQAEAAASLAAHETAQAEWQELAATWGDPEAEDATPKEEPTPTEQAQEPLTEQRVVTVQLASWGKSIEYMRTALRFLATASEVPENAPTLDEQVALLDVAEEITARVNALVDMATEGSLAR